MAKAKAKHVPMRMCMVTREKKPKAELVRFVCDTASGVVTLDPSGKLRGRGANLSLSMEIFEEAVKKGAFNRAFKKKISKENFEQLRADFEEYLERQKLTQGKKDVVVRVSGTSVKL